MLPTLSMCVCVLVKWYRRFINQVGITIIIITAHSRYKCIGECSTQKIAELIIERAIGRERRGKSSMRHTRNLSKQNQTD